MAAPFVGVALSLEGVAGLQRMERFTDPKLYDRAVAMGMKASGKTAQVQIAKGIGERYTISARRIKEDVRGPYIRGNTATIMASTKPPTANQYKFKPGRRGTGQPGLGRGQGWGKPAKPGRSATVQVFRGRSPQPVAGAFLSPSGLPFQRIRTGPGPGALKVLKGPSIARIFAGRGAFSRALQDQARISIEGSFNKAFEKVFSDAARGFGGK